jgi:hypothetical protein
MSFKLDSEGRFVAFMIGILLAVAGVSMCIGVSWYACKQCRCACNTNNDFDIDTDPYPIL